MISLLMRLRACTAARMRAVYVSRSHDGLPREMPAALRCLDLVLDVQRGDPGPRGVRRRPRHHDRTAVPGISVSDQGDMRVQIGDRLGILPHVV